METYNRSRFKLNSNAPTSLRTQPQSDRYGGGQHQLLLAQSNVSNEFQNGQVVQILGQSQGPNTYNMPQTSTKGTGIYGGYNKNGMPNNRSLQKRQPNKIAVNSKQVMSPRKRRIDPLSPDGRIKMISSTHAYKDSRYGKSSGRDEKAPPIMAINFSPSLHNLDIAPQLSEGVDGIQNVIFDVNGNDDFAIEDLKALKRDQRKKRMGRRMEVLKQKEEKKRREELARKAKLELTAVKAPNIKDHFALEKEQNKLVSAKDRESPLSPKAPILKPKANNHKSPEVIQGRRNNKLKQGKPVETVIQYKKQNTQKSRKQVSISEDKFFDDKKSFNLSPTAGFDSKGKKKINLRRGESIDSLPQKVLLPQNKTSDFAISSVGNLGKDDNDEGNSIISEEDSAFEDMTPHHKAASKTRASQLRGRESPKSKDVAAQDVGKFGGKPKQFKRQKTVGWKNQQANPSKWPCRRSPTNKSGAAKQVRQDSQGSGNKARFKMKIYDARDSDYLKSTPKVIDVRQRSGSKYRHRHGVSGCSRNSSLNYISDAMVDQLSMNFGKRYGNKQKNAEANMQETNSVVSVLTKGGTIVKPFNQLSNKQGKNLSIHHTNVSQKSRNHKLASQLYTKTQQRTAEAPQNAFSIGKNLRVAQKHHKNSNAQFDMNLDDSYTLHDLRNSIQATNKDLIKVYLQTPYKVLSINEVNRKLKMKNSKDQLFRAENILQLHTQYRNQELEAVGNQLSQGFDVNINRRQVQAGQDAVQQPTFVNTKSSLIQQESSHSQLSETKGSAFFDENNQGLILKASQPLDGRPTVGGIELDSQIQLNKSIYAAESQKMTGGGNPQSHHSHHLRHQKQKLSYIENEYKQQYYDSLREQILRRINQINFQTNIYRKQQKLFSIYGGPSYVKDINRDLMVINSSPKNLRAYDSLVGQSIQALNDASIHQNEQNFRISPELMTNSEIKDLRMQKLNEESRDSLHPSDQQVMAPRSFDMHAQSPQFSQSINNLGTDPSFIHEMMQSNDNLKDGSLEDMGGNPQMQHIRQLIDIAGTMNYPNNMQKELRQMEEALFLAEKQLEAHQRQRELHRFQWQTKQISNSVSPSGKLNIQSREISKPTLAKQHLQKDPTPLGMRISSPIRMDSYKFIKKRVPPKATKEYLDENSIEREGSLEQMDPNQSPKINRTNFSTINDPNNESNINESRDPTSWRHIESNTIEVKDYFENKLSMRRSIDKKMHYDHIRNQVHYPQNIQIRKHQKILEKKILYQSQKQQRQITTQHQADCVNINEGHGATGEPAKLSLSPRKEPAASQRGHNKLQSMNDDSFIKDVISSVHNDTPVKQTQRTKAAKPAQQSILPLMPLKEETARKNQLSTNQQATMDKVSHEAGQVSTHLPQIKCSTSFVAQSNTNSKFQAKSVRSRNSKYNGQIIFRQDQNSLRSPRSSQGGGGMANIISPLNQAKPQRIEEEDLSSVNQNKKADPVLGQQNAIKLEGIDSRKKMQLLSTSSQQTQQNRVVGTQKIDRESKYTSMPQLKQEKYNTQQEQQTRMKIQKYSGKHAYGNILLELQTRTPMTGDQKKLGFQFTNRSPKVVPPGGLKNIAFSNADVDPGSHRKLNIDYLDPEHESYTLRASSNVNARLQSIDNHNYQTHDMPNIVRESGQIFATSGPAIMSPGNQQSQGKGKFFNKNVHLMKGVLAQQQRRFSRIQSNKKGQPQNLKLDFSNSDLNQLYSNHSRGRNSMANSLPSKTQGSKPAAITTALDQQHQLAVMQKNNENIIQNQKDGGPQTDASASNPMNTQRAQFTAGRKEQVNGPVM